RRGARARAHTGRTACALDPRTGSARVPRPCAVTAAAWALLLRAQRGAQPAERTITMNDESRSGHRALSYLVAAALVATACGRAAVSSRGDDPAEAAGALTICPAGQTGALLCDGLQFAEPCQFFPASAGDRANLGTMNDLASSARSCGGAAYTLFVDPGFGAGSLPVQAGQSIANLGAMSN